MNMFEVPKLLALFLGVWYYSTSPAHAQHAASCQRQTLSIPTGKLLCTKTFHGQGKCDGKDQLPILEDLWEPEPISIVGTSIRWWASSDVHVNYVFAGNSYTPDVMNWLGGPGASTVMFPAGLVMPLGPKKHVDLHVSCYPAGVEFQGYFPQDEHRSTSSF